MKKLLASLLFAVCGHAFAASATFTADTTTVMPNPERGWYLLSGSLLSSSAAWDANLLAIRDTYGFRIAFGYTTLPTGTISGGGLGVVDLGWCGPALRGAILRMRSLLLHILRFHQVKPLRLLSYRRRSV